MNCPYCGTDDCVRLVGVPSVALLMSLAPFLGLGILGAAAAAVLVAKYKNSSKRIYKCERCNKYFIA